MKIAVTERAASQYRSLPHGIKRKFDKQIRFLLEDLRHPSLKAKKTTSRKVFGRGESTAAIVSIF